MGGLGGRSVTHLSRLTRQLGQLLLELGYGRGSIHVIDGILLGQFVVFSSASSASVAAIILCPYLAQFVSLFFILVFTFVLVRGLDIVPDYHRTHQEPGNLARRFIFFLNRSRGRRRRGTFFTLWQGQLLTRRFSSLWVRVRCYAPHTARAQITHYRP
uniref:Uncharacterized protein n=1 Tax=Cacopsylla melanoneura TaxID=428564 RepID=A0A8D8VCZ0_9HEMI